jgi:hypothetical protein
VAGDDIALLVAGAGIVLTVLYDVGATTISLSAVRGPFSGRLSAVVWSVGNRLRTKRRRLQRITGPLLLISILIGWFVTLTAGWTLIFSADGALTSTAAPEQQTSQVRWVDALFFVFGRLIGTGSSSLEPDEAGWSTAVALLTLSGVILLTLVIAWILPVVAAVVQKRALASKISALGGSPQGIVCQAWTGRDLGDLNLHLLPMIGELTILAQRHLAYPVIHYFHSSDDRTAIGPRIAALDEAITLIAAGHLDDVQRGTGLDVSVTRPLRQAISDYLGTLEYVFIQPSTSVPDPPAFDRLVAEGIVDGDTMRAELAERAEAIETRRSLLCGYVEHDGWPWSAVSDDTDAEEEDPEETD